MATNLPDIGRDIGTAGPWRRTFVRPLAALALALATLHGTLPAAAQSRHAAMVIDANSGETLYADKADEPRYPASLTKMMTLYMVFEQFESGRLTPLSKIKVSQEAASAQPTKLDLEPGEQIAAIDAVKALIAKSANDMAIALAEAIAGTEGRFAELMTQKARAIGMRATTFRNASGLPDPGQVTTARDMLTLALRLQDDFPKYYPLFALRTFSYNGTTYRNHNTMLNSFEGIDGIKTGYTRMSGFNLVTSLKRGDKHLVGAVFGGTTAGTRNLTMRLALTRALLKASTRKTRKIAPVLVARARPAVRPQPAKPGPAPAAVAAAPPRPQPAPAAAAPRPAPRPVEPASATIRPAAVPAAAPVAVAQSDRTDAAPEVATAEVADAPSPTELAAPIEIARVRPVMVAPRVRRTAFVIPPEPDEVSAPSRPEAAPPAPRAEPPSPAPTAAAPQRIALAPPPPAAAAIAPAVPAQRAALAPAAAPRVPPIQRGAQPSTLQAQAETLGRGIPTAGQMPVVQAAAAAPRPRGLDAAPLPSGFHIQIGAYASAAEAERVLKDTQTRSSGLLKSATPVTAPVQKENRLLYRARFAGFDAKGAADTCLALRRSSIDCFVMKAE